MLATTASSISYQGNGSTTAFSWPYDVITLADLKVYLVDDDDVETLQVSGVTRAFVGVATNGVYSGATITFSTAPSASYSVLIVRDPELTQNFDFDSEADPLPVLTRYADLTESKLQALSRRIGDGVDPGVQVLATGSTTVRSLPDRFSDVLNVLDWGVVADGTTDNTTALAAIVTYLNTLSAGELPEVVFPKGVYSYVTSPNWAITGLRVRFEGDVRLRCTGTGDCFIIDAGASGYCWDVGFYGWPKIEGAATTNDGVYMRGILRSVVQFNVRGCGAKAFNIEFCVLVKFDHPIVSNNEQSPGGFYGATPTHGMYFTRRGSGSDHSGHNIIINPILEGVPIGGYEDYCVGNTWHGGALEGCTNTGFVATANSREVEMFGVDFEVNTTMDLDLSCDGGEFYGLHLEDLITIRSGASHNKFFGGDFEVITVASGATYNKFVKCGYNRYGSGAFNNSGTGTEYDLWNITSATRIRSDQYNGTWTPVPTFATMGDAAFVTTGGLKTAIGKYTRIGDLVWFKVQVIFDVTHTTASGAFEISLPFTSANDSHGTPCSVSLATGVNPTSGNYIIGANVGANTDKVRLINQAQVGGTIAVIGTGNIATGSTDVNVSISGVYRAA